jgi:hypothetical protein
MGNQSKTPRTDKQRVGLAKEFVPTKLSRQLETELNQWKACAEELDKEIPPTVDGCDCPTCERNGRLHATFNKLKGTK